MKYTENFKLHLLEGTDPLSRQPLNENMALLDALLKSRDGEITNRAKVAAGSYEGKTACQEIPTYTDENNKKFGPSFGLPNSSASDTVITLDFEPRLLILSAYRGAPVSWSGTLQDEDGYNVERTLVGLERQCYRQIVCYGVEYSSAELHTKTPAKYFDAILNRDVFSWIRSMPYAGAYRAKDGDSNYSDLQTSFVDTLVEFGTTTDGKYTVTIKGDNGDYGTWNYADIEGMTYHWIAFG